jgi:hypothetical protein
MIAATLVNHGNRLSQFSLHLEIAKQKNGIRQITDLHRRLHFPTNDAVLSKDHEGRDPFLIQQCRELSQSVISVFPRAHRMLWRVIGPFPYVGGYRRPQAPPQRMLSR